MAGRLSDDGCSVGHEGDFVDASADMELDVRLPLEVDRRSEIGSTSEGCQDFTVSR